MALAVITGGARSGKSSAAERLALSRQAHGTSVVVAVFGHSADGCDVEFAARIAKHQAHRPAGFATFEVDGSAGALDAVADGTLLVVDCLGTWLGRIMEDEWTRHSAEMAIAKADAEALPEGFEQAVAGTFDRVVDSLITRAEDTIVVTNEVGDGIVPAYATGRLFRDLLGGGNRRLIDVADAAYLAVGGRLLELTALPREARWPED